MAEARMHLLEKRVANALAKTPPSLACPLACPEMSLYGTYCLTSTEQEAMLKQAREKMRRARLVQVRAQEMLFASRRLEQVRDQRQSGKQSLLRELKREWKAGQRLQLEELKEEIVAVVDSVGHAHRAASEFQRLKEVKEVTDALRTEERHCCAVLRYAEALQKEYTKREELESKKGIQLERRKRVEDTAEMDRNLARVSAYGAKIRSKLGHIKEVFQPECKLDCDVAKLRDYKYTFIHNHWAALKDKTNTLNETSAWEAADRKRVDHEQIRLRQREIAKIAKQQISQRGQAARVHHAKEQETRRLHTELKNVQRQEREQRIAAILSGESYPVGNLSGGQDTGLQKAAGSACLVDEERREDIHPHDYDITHRCESKVELLRLSPSQNHLKAVPNSSSGTITVHVPDDDVIADQALDDSSGKIASAELRNGSGVHPSQTIGKPEFSQAHYSKPLVMTRICHAVSPESANDTAPVTSSKRKAGLKNKAKRKLQNLVAMIEGNVRDGEEGPTNALEKGGRKRQVRLTEQINTRASRRFRGCGEGRVRDWDRSMRIRPGSAAGKLCVNLPKSAAHAHGEALACAVSLDEIRGTAEVLDNLQEPKWRSTLRGKLPVSMKHRICSTLEQVEALYEELFSQRWDVQGRRRISNTEVLNKSRKLSEGAQGSCFELRRKEGLEKHMRRMGKRSKIAQIGQNLWNILRTTDHPVAKMVETADGRLIREDRGLTAVEKKSSRGKSKGNNLEGARRQDKQKVQGKSLLSMQLEEGRGLTTVERKTSRGKSKGNNLEGARRQQKVQEKSFLSMQLEEGRGLKTVEKKTSRGKSKDKNLEGARRQHKQKVQEKSFLSMQLEEIEFLNELQESLQKLKQSSDRDGRISPPCDRVPVSYKGMMKQHSGLVTKSVSKVERSHRKPHCGQPHAKTKITPGRLPQEMASPLESGADIGPWNTDMDSVRDRRWSMSKFKRRNGSKPVLSDKARGCRDFSGEQTVPHGRPTRTVDQQVNGKAQTAVTTDRVLKIGSQDSSCISKGRIERSYKNEQPWPDQLTGIPQQQVTCESSAMDDLTSDDVMEKDSANKVENMSSSTEVTDVEAWVGAALALHDPNIFSEEDRAGACDKWLRPQAVETQVTSTDRDPDWDQAAGQDVAARHKEWTGTESCARNDSLVPSVTPLRLPKKAGWTWGKIWEEVCCSIDSELDRLGGADSAKVVDEVRHSSCLSSADTMKWSQHRDHCLELGSLRQPVVTHELDSSVAGGKEKQLYEDVAPTTDQPSLHSILGSLSQQVRELDERLRTATSSVVASSWVISESSRRSGQCISREGLRGSTDPTRDGSHLMDRLPVSYTGWLSLPVTVGRPTTDDSFSEQETSFPSMLEVPNIVPRTRMRRTTVHLEGLGDSDGFSTETGSPVSPLGLCFDTVHDRQRRDSDGVNRQRVDSRVLNSHGAVPDGKLTTLPLRWATKDNGGDNRLLQLPGQDVYISHLGPSVLVLPSCPRTGKAKRDSGDTEDSGETPRKTSLFFRSNETSGNGSGCKLVLSSLSSLDLEIGESLLSESIDFSHWSPEKMRDIFDAPVANEVHSCAKRHEFLLKTSSIRKKTKGRGSNHQRPNKRPHQLCKSRRPLRTLSIIGSTGNWSIKPRRVTKITLCKAA